MTVTIPSLPTPVPQSTDPQNFAARADEFLVALPPMAGAMNAQNAENNVLNASTAAAAASAAASSLSAKNSSDLAVASASAGPFSATADYPEGGLAWSRLTGVIYRRRSAGRSATDPSQDIANWVDVKNLPIGTGADQVPASQMLGALAFVEKLGVLTPMQAPPGEPRSIWFDFVSDTSLKLWQRGDDGVARFINLTNFTTG